MGTYLYEHNYDYKWAVVDSKYKTIHEYIWTINAIQIQPFLALYND